MLRERRARLDAEAVDDVDDTGRQQVADDLEEEQDRLAGVCSAGLSTTQLPAARAGASFHVAMRIGKFHGMICPTTPSGSLKWYATVSSSIWLSEPSWARSTPAK